MAVESLLALITTLARGDFGEILGTPESSWIDFKSAPYGLDTDRSRWELAKDVSAFANAVGGGIVIGWETDVNEASRIETASVRRPTSLAALKVQASKDIVRSWIYPLVREFDVQWFLDPDENDLGYGLLHIPAQREDDKPFVIRRMSEGGEKGAVGIAERDGSDTAWWGAERFHHRLQSQAPSVGTERAGGREDAVSDESVQDRLDEHLRRNEDIEQWSESPVVHLQAIPPHTAERLPNFYNRNGIWGALNEPPRLRPGGWNLSTAFEPEVDEGALVARSPSTDVLRLEPNGLFTISGIADASFLCWAMDQGRRPTDPLPLNPIAVSEWVYSFFMFVNEELKPYMSGRWTYRLAALRLQSSNIGMFGGHWRRTFPQSATLASSDNWIQTFPEDAQARETLGLGELTTGDEAFIALDRLYGLFGLGNDVIPFTEGEKVVISAEAINAT